MLFSIRIRTDLRTFMAILLVLPGFLAGPSGIRAGWALETKSRLGAE